MVFGEKLNSRVMCFDLGMWVGITGFGLIIDGESFVVSIIQLDLLPRSPHLLDSYFFWLH